MGNKEYFSTSDLNLSAVLVANGFPLEDLEKVSSGKSTFHFSKSKDLDKLVKQYLRFELTIEPHRLLNSLKALKNQMYNEY